MLCVSSQGEPAADLLSGLMGRDLITKARRLLGFCRNLCARPALPSPSLAVGCDMGCQFCYTGALGPPVLDGLTTSCCNGAWPAAWRDPSQAAASWTTDHGME